MIFAAISVFSLKLKRQITLFPTHITQFSIFLGTICCFCKSYVKRSRPIQSETVCALSYKRRIQTEITMNDKPRRIVSGSLYRDYSAAAPWYNLNPYSIIQRIILSGGILRLPVSGGLDLFQFENRHCSQRPLFHSRDEFWRLPRGLMTTTTRTRRVVVMGIN